MKNSSKKIIVTVDYYYLFSLSYRNISETLRDVVVISSNNDYMLSHEYRNFSSNF